MLPWLSVVTSTPGWDSSKATATFSKGTMRLPA